MITDSFMEGKGEEAANVDLRGCINAINWLCSIDMGVVLFPWRPEFVGDLVHVDGRVREEMSNAASEDMFVRVDEQN